MSGAAVIVRVALDVPVATLFDYLAEDVTREDAGLRVLVPFGNKTAIGLIIDFARGSALPPDRIKRVLKVLRDEPALGARDLELLRFASDYYHHPLGTVVMGALPARLRRSSGGAPARLSGEYALTELGSADDQAAVPARAAVKRLLIERLKAGPLDYASIESLSPRAPRVLAQLIETGWVRQTDATRFKSSAVVPVSPPPLTTEQADAVTRIRESLGTFRAQLLLGVPGSGKTEVYLHAVAAVLAQGRQALILVPEISLTPQLEALVSARFPGIPVGSLHSGLNEGERLAHWLAAHSGRARIVLGTRLAVFTPLPHLGIIIVDEEHDASFKQTEGFRYSARDLAVVRAQQRNVPVILASATPALETYHNAVTGRYGLLRLTQRIGAMHPSIGYLDTRSERPREGLSQALLSAVSASHARGDQSLVFINRRGFAPVLMCRSCGWISGCHRCAAQLVLHLKDRRLRCHHCGHEVPLPAACPECGNQDLAPVGQGTQRVEAALAARFSMARVVRIDRDSIRRRHVWPALRRQIENREIDILVGTQILAKGHDFPHLNLVGVVNADSLLYSADFRASERLYALLTQVAGRAGRGATRGTVLIQTEFPGHPLFQALQQHDYSAFAEGLLAERRQAGFPPYVHQALLRAEASRLSAALDFLETAARNARRLVPPVTIYDPVPAALPRRAGRERAQLLVQAESRRHLQQFLQGWYRQLSTQRATRARWSLDVDPIEF
ncbi:MAG TPA: primosomal protein N' [Burkholderiales bacterium]|nr:primosomal protein N' [Burkholderiales bacterium]